MYVYRNVYIYVCVYVCVYMFLQDTTHKLDDREAKIKASAFILLYCDGIDSWSGMQCNGKKWNGKENKEMGEM